MTDTDGQDAAPIDVAPGEEVLDGTGVAQGARGYAIGLGLALALTAASFYFVRAGLIWGPAIPAALIALAIGQMGVHVVFFFHVSSGPDDTNNFLALAFGIFVVGLVVFGSMLIMSNLNANMMPMERLMDMQR